MKNRNTTLQLSQLIRRIPYLLLLTVLFATFTTGCGEKALNSRVTYHPNNTIWERWQEDRAGLKEGKALTYYDTGQLQTEAEFVNGYLHGEFVMWSKEGKQLCKGTYQDGDPWAGTFIFADEQQGVIFRRYEKGKIIE